MNVGLNICEKNIKILALQGRQVKKWATADLPSGLVRDGLILQPKAVGEAINALFKSAGMPRDKVIFSVSGLSFTYRFIRLPHIKPSLLEEAIIRAAKKEISLPLDELYLSWQQLPDEGDEFSFFVLGIPRNLIDAMVETLKIAGIEPYLMDLRPLALARTAERSDAIIVNIEAGCFDIVFMSGGVPRVIHTILPRSDNSTLEDNIHRLADELTKTTAFYQSNNPNTLLNNTTPLLLTGEWATDSTTSALLQTEVEYPVQPLTPHVEIPEGMPMDSFAAIIGLALKKNPQQTAKKIAGANFIDVNINVLAGKYRKVKKSKPVSPVYLWLGIFLVVAVILLYPLYQAQAKVTTENTALEMQLNDVKRQINISMIINEDNILIEEMIQSVNATADAVKKAYLNTIGTRGDFTADIETVTSLIPSLTLFTTLETNQDEIAIHGETDSVFNIVNYATALEATGAFYDVRINELSEGTSAVFAEDNPESLTPITVTKFEIVITKQAPDATQ
jgi:Tfp pilus assembly PilM family ATPase/Tfp pilus assembly protein PilN